MLNTFCGNELEKAIEFFDDHFRLCAGDYEDADRWPQIDELINKTENHLGSVEFYNF